MSGFRFPQSSRRGGQPRQRNPFPMGGGRRPTMRTRPQMRQRRGPNIRLIIALAIAGFAFFSYYNSAQVNPITGEKQFVAGMKPEQEIALGLQAMPQMVQQHGGQHPDPKAQQLVDRIGWEIVHASAAKEAPYKYDFHLLADPQTVNAFALPGGQIFITEALFRKFETHGQLAGVLGHEIGHVVARHGAQRMAKGKLTQGLIGAVLAGSGSQNTTRMAAMVGNMINMKYGRDDELESDELGVVFMTQAGYDPHALIGVMQILEAATGGKAPPEFQSTHPSPKNRVGKIKAAIQKHYPQGLPPGLIP